MECTITLELTRCKGCESCVVVCPEVFRMSGATEKAELLVSRTTLTAALEEAVAICPTHCLELVCGDEEHR